MALRRKQRLAHSAKAIDHGRRYMPAASQAAPFYISAAIERRNYAATPLRSVASGAVGANALEACRQLLHVGLPTTTQLGRQDYQVRQTTPSNASCMLTMTQNWKAYSDCLRWTILAWRYAAIHTRRVNQCSHTCRIHGDCVRRHWILGTIYREPTGCVEATE
jgi:hypothetical protein